MLKKRTRDGVTWQKKKSLSEDTKSISVITQKARGDLLAPLSPSFCPCDLSKVESGSPCNFSWNQSETDRYKCRYKSQYTEMS